MNNFKQTYATVCNMMMGIKESTVSPSFCYFNTKNGRSSLTITLYYIHGMETVL